MEREMVETKTKSIEMNVILFLLNSLNMILLDIDDMLDARCCCCFAEICWNEGDIEGGEPIDEFDLIFVVVGVGKLEMKIRLKSYLCWI